METAVQTKVRQIGKRKDEIISPESIRKAYTTVCCKRHCIFNCLSLDTMRKERRDYSTLNRKEQNRFIKQKIKCATSDLTFYVEGKPLCKKAFMECYGVKKSRFYNLQRQMKKKTSYQSDENYGRRESFVSIKATVWMSNYFAKFGDSMPDTGEVHLPTCLNAISVYQQYMAENTNNWLGKTQFFKLWKKEFPLVKVVKHQKLTVCTDCKHFKMAMVKNLTKDEMEKLQNERKLHLTLQRLCRIKYYKHCKKAKDNPSMYVSVIIDNMDQQKTNLPHFSVKSKVDQSLQTMKHHITGVLNHGQDRAYMFTWGDHFSGDSNVMINCLSHVLVDIAKNNKGVMPPVLYLQADNCPKDNKNRFIVAFLASLIKQGVFKKIKLSFLMVGHTHEDIDQMFSCVSRKLQRNDAQTLQHLHEVARNSYSPIPTTVHVNSLVDFKSQLDCGRLEGIKTPHIFKLEMLNNQVQLSYKDWPLVSEEYRSLSINGMANSQFSSDKLVEPNSNKLQECQDKMALDKYERTGVLSREQVQWWYDYLESMEEKAKSTVNLSLPQYAFPEHEETSHPELQVLSERVNKLSKTSTIKYK